MKRLFGIVLTLAAFLTGLVSCMSNPHTPPKRTYQFNTHIDTDFPRDDVSVEFNIRGYYRENEAEWVESYYGGEPTLKEIILKINNNTKSSVKVNFEESYLVYDGTSHVPYINGQNNGGIAAPRFAPQNSYITFTLNSTDQQYRHTWSELVSGTDGGLSTVEHSELRMHPMDFPITAHIAVEIEGLLYYWECTATASEIIEEVPEYSE